MIDRDDAAVIPAGGLDTAPPRHKRQIVDVDLEHVEDSRLGATLHLKACQHCGDAVDLLQPHAYACLWVPAKTGRMMHKPVFCGSECWLAWLRTGKS